MEQTSNINKEIEFMETQNSYMIKVNDICVYDMGTYLSNIRRAVLKVPKEEYYKLTINFKNAKYVDDEGNKIDIKDLHPSILFDTFLVPAHLAIKKDISAKFELNDEFKNFIKEDIKKGKERNIRLPLEKLLKIIGN